MKKALSSMKSSKQLVIAVCVSIIFSFLYGVITVQYKIPPFDQLRVIKQLVSPSPSYSDYFYIKKSFFEQLGGHQYDVVFIGDSITDYAEWEDLFPSLKIANRGIAGDRTDGVLKRMDSIYSTNAKKAFIMIGTNDIAAGTEVDDIVENYKSIISNLVAHGMQTYVQSTILAGSHEAERNQKIMALNDQLKRMADENQSFIYINLNKGLARDSVLDSKYSQDDIHLNASGYALWKDMIKSYIQ
jgi:lysophospholipase L1-like esterase